MNVPFRDLTKDQKRAVIEGRGKWSGIRVFYEWLETKNISFTSEVFLSKYVVTLFARTAKVAA